MVEEIEWGPTGVGELIANLSDDVKDQIQILIQTYTGEVFDSLEFWEQMNDAVGAFRASQQISENSAKPSQIRKELKTAYKAASKLKKQYKEMSMATSLLLYVTNNSTTENEGEYVSLIDRLIEEADRHLLILDRATEKASHFRNARPKDHPKIYLCAHIRILIEKYTGIVPDAKPDGLYSQTVHSVFDDLGEKSEDVSRSIKNGLRVKVEGGHQLTDVKTGAPILDETTGEPTWIPISFSLPTT